MNGDSKAANEMEVVMNTDTQSSGQTVQLTDIGQIALTVRDLGRAKNFYQNTLGMRFLFDAGTMAFFQCGEIRLMIGLSEESAAIGGTILYFKVPDIQAVHGVLKNQGVTFVQVPHLVARMPDHDLWMAFLKDTEGNTLGLMSEVRTERVK
jgi:methylmalonyl-CoA/ethylmalonyl-CoA epimerase